MKGAPPWAATRPTRGVGAQLPIAQMARGEQHPAPAALGFLVMLEAVVADPLADVARIDIREPRERDQKACERFEPAVDDIRAVPESGEGEVTHSHTAEPRHDTI